MDFLDKMEQIKSRIEITRKESMIDIDPSGMEKYIS